MFIIFRSYKSNNVGFNLTFLRHTSKGKDEKTAPKKKLPEAPTTCCMSGCANCVWLEYAEQLSEYYRDGGAKALKEINETVTDPNIRAFLLHELRMRHLK